MISHFFYNISNVRSLSTELCHHIALSCLFTYHQQLKWFNKTTCYNVQSNGLHNIAMFKRYYSYTQSTHHHLKSTTLSQLPGDDQVTSDDMYDQTTDIYPPVDSNRHDLHQQSKCMEQWWDNHYPIPPSTIKQSRKKSNKHMSSHSKDDILKRQFEYNNDALSYRELKTDVHEDIGLKSKGIFNTSQHTYFKNITHQTIQLSDNDPDTLSESLKSNTLMDSLTLEDTECIPQLETPFVDFIEISITAGNGGQSRPGCTRCPTGGGPGYGGHGSDIILESSHYMHNLTNIKNNITGDHGEDAWDSHRGLHASPTCIQIPLGTIVRTRERLPVTGNKKKYQYLFWHQFLTSGEQLIVAQGGRGGMGCSTQGGSSVRPSIGEKRRLQLELRLINDAALIGFPNSGKTSLCSSLTRSYSRIGPEPCSSSQPHLGMLHYKDGITLTLCDLPALFKGAHKDTIKGRRILRHIYRSKLIIYVIDMSNRVNYQESCHTLLKEFLILRSEIRHYHPAVLHKREMIIGTKCDMIHRDALYNLDSLYFRLKASFPDIPIIGVSARFGLGLERVVTLIRQQIYPDMADDTSRIFVKPIEDILRPSKNDIQQIIERLDYHPLPSVLQSTSKTPPSLQTVPVTHIHPSYTQHAMPVISTDQLCPGE